MRHEQEHRRRRRLFKRLEQRILRLGTSRSASSTMTTRRRPSNGRNPACSTTPRIASTLMVRCRRAPPRSRPYAPRGDPPARAARPQLSATSAASLASETASQFRQLGQPHRDLALADAVRTRQHQARRQPIPRDRPGKQATNRRMPPDRAEPHDATPRFIVAVYTRSHAFPDRTGGSSRTNGRAEETCRPSDRRTRGAGHPIPGAVEPRKSAAATDPSRACGPGVRRAEPRPPDCSGQGGLESTRGLDGDERMAGPTRLELATSGVTGRRSNQLNYDPASS